jgi:hypothetical protein
MLPQRVSRSHRFSGRSGVRPDLAAVPVEGNEPCNVLFATRAGERGRLVTAFR